MEVDVIKVNLLGTNPPIWRRLLVQRHISLRDLHKTLQTAMGWTNSHLHQFVFKRQKYSNPKHGLGAGIIDENRTRLGDVICTPGTKLLYEYDFGDGWQHELLLEEVLLGDESFQQICGRDNEIVRPKTAEDHTDLLSFLKHFRTPLTQSTMTSSSGSVTILRLNIFR
jgi:Plasmid pRiA4b ORF-3-like protein